MGKKNIQSSSSTTKTGSNTGANPRVINAPNNTPNQNYINQPDKKKQAALREIVTNSANSSITDSQPKPVTHVSQFSSNPSSGYNSHNSTISTRGSGANFVRNNTIAWGVNTDTYSRNPIPQSTGSGSIKSGKEKRSDKSNSGSESGSTKSSNLSKLGKLFKSTPSLNRKGSESAHSNSNNLASSRASSGSVQLLTVFDAPSITNHSSKSDKGKFKSQDKLKQDQEELKKFLANQQTQKMQWALTPDNASRTSNHINSQPSSPRQGVGNPTQPSPFPSMPLSASKPNLPTAHQSDHVDSTKSSTQTLPHPSRKDLNKQMNGSENGEPNTNLNSLRQHANGNIGSKQLSNNNARSVNSGGNTRRTNEHRYRTRTVQETYFGTFDRNATPFDDYYQSDTQSPLDFATLASQVSSTQTLPYPSREDSSRLRQHANGLNDSKQLFNNAESVHSGGTQEASHGGGTQEIAKSIQINSNPGLNLELPGVIQNVVTTSTNIDPYALENASITKQSQDIDHDKLSEEAARIAKENEDINNNIFAMLSSARYNLNSKLELPVSNPATQTLPHPSRKDLNKQMNGSENGEPKTNLNSQPGVFTDNAKIGKNIVGQEFGESVERIIGLINSERASTIQVSSTQTLPHPSREDSSRLRQHANGLNDSKQLFNNAESVHSGSTTRLTNENRYRTVRVTSFDTNQLGSGTNPGIMQRNGNKLPIDIQIDGHPAADFSISKSMLKAPNQELTQNFEKVPIKNMAQNAIDEQDPIDEQLADNSHTYALNSPPQAPEQGLNDLPVNDLQELESPPQKPKQHSRYTDTDDRKEYFTNNENSESETESNNYRLGMQSDSPTASSNSSRSGSISPEDEQTMDSNNIKVIIDPNTGLSIGSSYMTGSPSDGSVYGSRVALSTIPEASRESINTLAQAESTHDPLSKESDNGVPDTANGSPADSASRASSESMSPEDEQPPSISPSSSFDEEWRIKFNNFYGSKVSITTTISEALIKEELRSQECLVNNENSESETESNTNEVFSRTPLEELQGRTKPNDYECPTDLSSSTENIRNREQDAIDGKDPIDEQLEDNSHTSVLESPTQQPEKDLNDLPVNDLHGSTSPVRTSEDEDKLEAENVSNQGQDAIDEENPINEQFANSRNPALESLTQVPKQDSLSSKNDYTNSGNEIEPDNDGPGVENGNPAASLSRSSSQSMLTEDGQTNNASPIPSADADSKTDLNEVISKNDYTNSGNEIEPDNDGPGVENGNPAASLSRSSSQSMLTEDGQQNSGISSSYFDCEGFETIIYKDKKCPISAQIDLKSVETQEPEKNSEKLPVSTQQLPVNGDTPLNQTTSQYTLSHRDSAIPNSQPDSTLTYFEQPINIFQNELQKTNPLSQDNRWLSGVTLEGSARTSIWGGSKATLMSSAPQSPGASNPSSPEDRSETTCVEQLNNDELSPQSNTNEDLNRIQLEELQGRKNPNGYRHSTDLSPGTENISNRDQYAIDEEDHTDKQLADNKHNPVLESQRQEAAQDLDDPSTNDLQERNSPVIDSEDDEKHEKEDNEKEDDYEYSPDLSPGTENISNRDQYAIDEEDHTDKQLADNKHNPVLESQRQEAAQDLDDLPTNDLQARNSPVVDSEDDEKHEKEDNEKEDDYEYSPDLSPGTENISNRDQYAIDEEDHTDKQLADNKHNPVLESQRQEAAQDLDDPSTNDLQERNSPVIDSEDKEKLETERSTDSPQDPSIDESVSSRRNSLLTPILESTSQKPEQESLSRKDDHDEPGEENGSTAVGNPAYTSSSRSKSMSSEDEQTSAANTVSGQSHLPLSRTTKQKKVDPETMPLTEPSYVTDFPCFYTVYPSKIEEEPERLSVSSIVKKLEAEAKDIKGPRASTNPNPQIGHLPYPRAHQKIKNEETEIVPETYKANNLNPLIYIPLPVLSTETFSTNHIMKNTAKNQPASGIDSTKMQEGQMKTENQIQAVRADTDVNENLDATLENQASHSTDISISNENEIENTEYQQQTANTDDEEDNFSLHSAVKPDPLEIALPFLETDHASLKNPGIYCFDSHNNEFPNRNGAITHQSEDSVFEPSNNEATMHTQAHPKALRSNAGAEISQMPHSDLTPKEPVQEPLLQPETPCKGILKKPRYSEDKIIEQKPPSRSRPLTKSIPYTKGKSKHASHDTDANAKDRSGNKLHPRAASYDAIEMQQNNNGKTDPSSHKNKTRERSSSNDQSSVKRSWRKLKGKLRSSSERSEKRRESITEAKNITASENHTQAIDVSRQDTKIEPIIPSRSRQLTRNMQHAKGKSKHTHKTDASSKDGSGNNSLHLRAASYDVIGLQQNNNGKTDASLHKTAIGMPQNNNHETDTSLHKNKIRHKSLSLSNAPKTLKQVGEALNKTKENAKELPENILSKLKEFPKIAKGRTTDFKNTHEPKKQTQVTHDPQDILVGSVGEFNEISIDKAIKRIEEMEAKEQQEALARRSHSATRISSEEQLSQQAYSQTTGSTVDVGNENNATALPLSATEHSQAILSTEFTTPCTPIQSTGDGDTEVLPSPSNHWEEIALRGAAHIPPENTQSEPSLATRDFDERNVRELTLPATDYSQAILSTEFTTPCTPIQSTGDGDIEVLPPPSIEGNHCEEIALRGAAHTPPENTQSAPELPTISNKIMPIQAKDEKLTPSSTRYTPARNNNGKRLMDILVNNNHNPQISPSNKPTKLTIPIQSTNKKSPTNSSEHMAEPPVSGNPKVSKPCTTQKGKKKIGYMVHALIKEGCIDEGCSNLLREANSSDEESIGRGSNDPKGLHQSGPQAHYNPQTLYEPQFYQHICDSAPDFIRDGNSSDEESYDEGNIGRGPNNSNQPSSESREHDTGSNDLNQTGRPSTQSHHKPPIPLDDTLFYQTYSTGSIFPTLGLTSNSSTKVPSHSNAEKVKSHNNIYDKDTSFVAQLPRKESDQYESEIFDVNTSNQNVMLSDSDYGYLREVRSDRTIQQGRICNPNEHTNFTVTDNANRIDDTIDRGRLEEVQDGNMPPSSAALLSSVTNDGATAEISHILQNVKPESPFNTDLVSKDDHNTETEKFSHIDEKNGSKLATVASPRPSSSEIIIDDNSTTDLGLPMQNVQQEDPFTDSQQNDEDSPLHSTTAPVETDQQVTSSATGISRSQITAPALPGQGMYDSQESSPRKPITADSEIKKSLEDDEVLDDPEIDHKTEKKLSFPIPALLDQDTESEENESQEMESPRKPPLSASSGYEDDVFETDDIDPSNHSAMHAISDKNHFQEKEFERTIQQGSTYNPYANTNFTVTNYGSCIDDTTDIDQLEEALDDHVTEEIKLKQTSRDISNFTNSLSKAKTNSFPVSEDFSITGKNHDQSSDIDIPKISFMRLKESNKPSITEKEDLVSHTESFKTPQKLFINLDKGIKMKNDINYNDNTSKLSYHKQEKGTDFCNVGITNITQSQTPSTARSAPLSLQGGKSTLNLRGNSFDSHKLDSSLGTIPKPNRPRSTSISNPSKEGNKNKINDSNSYRSKRKVTFEDIATSKIETNTKSSLSSTTKSGTLLSSNYKELTLLSSGTPKPYKSYEIPGTINWPRTISKQNMSTLNSNKSETNITPSSMPETARIKPLPLSIQTSLLPNENSSHQINSSFGNSNKHTPMILGNNTNQELSYSTRISIPEQAEDMNQLISSLENTFETNESERALKKRGKVSWQDRDCTDRHTLNNHAQKPSNEHYNLDGKVERMLAGINATLSPLENKSKIGKPLSYTENIYNQKKKQEHSKVNNYAQKPSNEHYNLDGEVDQIRAGINMALKPLEDRFKTGKTFSYIDNKHKQESSYKKHDKVSWQDIDYKDKHTLNNHAQKPSDEHDNTDGDQEALRHQKESQEHNEVSFQDTNYKDKYIINNYVKKPYSEHASESRDIQKEASMYTKLSGNIIPNQTMQVSYVTSRYPNSGPKPNYQEIKNYGNKTGQKNVSPGSTLSNKDMHHKTKYMPIAQSDSSQNTQVKQKRPLIISLLKVLIGITTLLAYEACLYFLCCFSAFAANKTNGLVLNLFALQSNIPLIVFSVFSLFALLITVIAVAKNILDVEKDEKAQATETNQNQSGKIENTDAKNDHDKVNDLQSEKSVNTQKTTLEYNNHQVGKQSHNKPPSTVLQEVNNTQEADLLFKKPGFVIQRVSSV